MSGEIWEAILIWGTGVGMYKIPYIMEICLCVYYKPTDGHGPRGIQGEIAQAGTGRGPSM